MLNQNSIFECVQMFVLVTFNRLNFAVGYFISTFYIIYVVDMESIYGTLKGPSEISKQNIIHCTT